MTSARAAVPLRALEKVAAAILAVVELPRADDPPNGNLREADPEEEEGAEAAKNSGR